MSPDTPRERRDLDPGEICPECGGALRLVGEDPAGDPARQDHDDVSRNAATTRPRCAASNLVGMRMLTPTISS